MSAVRRIAVALPAILWAVVRLVTSRASPAGRSGPPAEPAPLEPQAVAPGGAVRVARIVLIGLGAVLIGIAGGLLVAQVPSRQWLGLAIWLGAAIVLHDGIFAPLVLVGSRVLRRAGRRLSWAAVAVVQIALVVGAALTFVAFPGIRAQQLGARNPTILVFDYAVNLGLAWAVLGAVTAVVVVLLARRRAR